MNIQHFESQVDTVAQITGIRVQETVPDTILDAADEVQVIDIPLEELTEGSGRASLHSRAGPQGHGELLPAGESSSRSASLR